MTDDFCIAEDADVAYGTTHRQNTVLTSSLQSASKVWTRRRCGSTSMFRPAAMSTTPRTLAVYSDPGVQSECVSTPKPYVLRCPGR
jgi:hypothetical protein